jgi:hypothetical protein
MESHGDGECFARFTEFTALISEVLRRRTYENITSNYATVYYLD